MSDRRMIVLTLAALLAVAGVFLATAGALGLRSPIWHGGETGELRDVSRELVAALVVGVALLIAGVTTVVCLIRAQLRPHAG